VPPDRIGATQAFAQTQRESRQKVVTGVVAETVIELLEAVEVDEQYC